MFYYIFSVLFTFIVLRSAVRVSTKYRDSYKSYWRNGLKKQEIFEDFNYSTFLTLSVICIFLPIFNILYSLFVIGFLLNFSAKTDSWFDWSDMSKKIFLVRTKKEKTK